MGASGTPLMYAFREREKILDLFEALSGARMMCNYMRFGGVRVDCSAEWLDAARRIVAAFPRFLGEFEQLISGNEILLARTQGIGVLPRELAINAGATGVMLRATGVNYDIRKVDNYGVYGRFNFRVPLGEHGDVYDRYMLRVLEMHESLKILEEALDGLPPRSDYGSQDQTTRPASQTRRGLRAHRIAQGRAWFLSHQRWNCKPLPVPCASSKLHPSDGA